MLNKDMILTGDDNERIIQWKIENDNLKLISIKDNAHYNRIYTLLKLGNRLFFQEVMMNLLKFGKYLAYN